VINVRENRLKLDRRFDVDFNRDITTGPARPHGVVALHAKDRWHGGETLRGGRRPSTLCQCDVRFEAVDERINARRAGVVSP
jgi:hypothetical protein